MNESTMSRTCLIILLTLFYQMTLVQAINTDSLRQVLANTKGQKRIETLVEMQQAFTCKNDSLARKYFQLAIKSEGLQTKEEVRSLANFGKMLYCAGQLDSAIHFYKVAVKKAENQAVNLEGPALLSKLGFLFQTAGNLDSSAHYFQKGLYVAKSVSDSLSLGSISVGLGTYYQHLGQMDSAVSLYLRALQIAELIDSKELLITARLNLSTYYYDHQPNKLRIGDFEEMLRLTREIGDRQREMSVLEWLGYLQTDSGDYELAIAYFNEGLDVSRSIQDAYGELLLLQGISYTYNTSGDHLRSIANNNKIIDRARSTGYETYLPSIYTNNVTNYLALGQYQNAINDALQAIDAGEKSGQVELYYKVYKDLGTAYEKLGQFRKAYESQVEYTKLNAKILDESKSKQLTEMETKYETEKKEAEIVALSNQAMIRDLELKQKNTVIIVGLAMLILVSIGTYLFIRQRNLKSQQTQMELEQRFLRSQLNPHFISNALLAVQNFMLKNETDNAALYLSKFAKLMRETLENSRKEFILLEDEVKMLSNFIDIHKMRLNDTFDYQIEISEDIDPETDSIPPMFVQPFVENAIEHGIPNARERGRIDISFAKEGEYISIEVRDNGGGIVSDKAKVSDHVSLSTTIIKERMVVFNKTLKSKIEVAMENVKGENQQIEGSRVELKVPFRYI